MACDELEAVIAALIERKNAAPRPWRTSFPDQPSDDAQDRETITEPQYATAKGAVHGSLGLSAAFGD